MVRAEGLEPSNRLPDNELRAGQHGADAGQDTPQVGQCQGDVQGGGVEDGTQGVIGPSQGGRSESTISAQSGSGEHSISIMAEGLPPDLASVVDAWDNLPEPIKAGILAMVEAARGQTGA